MGRSALTLPTVQLNTISSLTTVFNEIDLEDGRIFERDRRSVLDRDFDLAMEFFREWAVL
jgi:hypothetical protein